MPVWTEQEQALARGIQKTAGARETGLETGCRAWNARCRGRPPTIREISPSRAARASRFLPTSPTCPSTMGGGYCGSTSIAHKGTVAGAKVLAGSAIDLLVKPELLLQAKESFAGSCGFVLSFAASARSKAAGSHQRGGNGQISRADEPHYLRVPSDSVVSTGSLRYEEILAFGHQPGPDRTHRLRRVRGVPIGEAWKVMLHGRPLWIALGLVLVFVHMSCVRSAGGLLSPVKSGFREGTCFLSR